MAQEQWKYPNIENPHSTHEKGLTKHRFVERASLLDDYHKNSKLSHCEFRGILNLLVILSFFFLVVRPLNHRFEMGSYFNRRLYDSIRYEFLSCLMIWPIFSIWSYSAFVLEKLHVMGYNKKLLRVLKHCSQIVILVFGTVVVIRKNWPVSHRSFVLMQMFVHFMKMHSYTNTNRDYRHQANEAKAKGEKPLTSYPANINLRNFAHYMLVPVLVYDEKYPLKEKRDYLYLAYTGAATLLVLLAMYLISTEYIVPIIELGNRISFYELLSRSILPISIFMILLFYIIFECICNFFGELSRFTDRGFYRDWWNSTTYEEFNRLWNQPVHEFLFRHVYLEAIMRFKTTKKQAQFLTFLFSAILHELLLAVIFNIVRPILSTIMMFQIPLFQITKKLRQRKLGNYIFWFGLCFGPPFIISLYLRSDARVTSYFENPALHK